MVKTPSFKRLILRAVLRHLQLTAERIERELGEERQLKRTTRNRDGGYGS